MKEGEGKEGGARLVFDDESWKGEGRVREREVEGENVDYENEEDEGWNRRNGRKIRNNQRRRTRKNGS